MIMQMWSLEKIDHVRDNDVNKEFDSLGGELGFWRPDNHDGYIRAIDRVLWISVNRV